MGRVRWRSPSPLDARLSLGVLVGVMIAGLLAGCDPPPGLGETPSPPVPVPAGPPSPTPTFQLPPLPTIDTTRSPGFSQDRAVSCAGEPTADEVLALLRGEGVLTEDTDATVTNGPLCAGTWQYAVISVPDLEPLQVVTRGEPDALELVTAGTEVCTVDVRIQAPPGIRTAATCVG
jgi:hypothetical protein